MTDALTVWLYGEAVARIWTTRNRRLRLRYTEAALGRYELGEPLLSYQLPVSRTDFSNVVTASFLEGLLPEGEILRAVAEELDLRASDTYALISALGRDCAGALVIQPEGAPPPRVPTIRTAERLTDDQLAGLIDGLGSAPLGIDQRVRLSLGGAQEKLLVTRTAEGSWGRPVEGTPSTHILKPQIRGYHHTVENEAFSMRVAARCGLRTADIDTMTVLGRPLLVVKRFDRVVLESGTVERIHQEDFCQALAIRPRQKYQEGGGPSLRQIAGILQAVAPEEDLDEFLRAVTLNVALGNGDAHGKNYSLLHERTGKLRLAPLYDLLSTVVYGQDRLAMYVDNVQKTDRVTAARIVNEAAGWGVPRQRASRVVNALLERVPSAIDSAARETAGLPREFLERIRQQLEVVRSA